MRFYILSVPRLDILFPGQIDPNLHLVLKNGSLIQKEKSREQMLSSHGVSVVKERSKLLESSVEYLTLENKNPHAW